MTSLRSPRPLLAIFAVMTLAVGCADDDDLIGGLDETAGEDESGETEEGEGEGGEELEQCVETVTVLADANTPTPEGHTIGEVFALVLGPHDLELMAAEAEGDVSIVTSVPPVLQVELVVSYEAGEIRYIDSVPSDGSAATCVPRVEADVIVSVETGDPFFHSKFDTALVAEVGEGKLEAPTVLRALEDLGELGSVELLEIEPADPTALSYELGFLFSVDGVTGELRGVASYQEAGLDGDVAVSALGFKLFLFSE